jgi:hypothetical protein
MNWTALVYGGPMLLVTIWWLLSARKWFKGPKVNVEHMMLGRGANVLEGKADVSEGEDPALERVGSTHKDKGKDIRR